MKFNDIHYEVEDGRARITLSRPDSHNAITSTMLRELEEAVWEADDDTVRILEEESAADVRGVIHCFSGSLDCIGRPAELS